MPASLDYAAQCHSAHANQSSQTVLKGETIDGKKRFFESNGTKHPNPRQNHEAYRSWMAKLEFRHDNFPWLWTKELLIENPDDRPSARVLLRNIQRCTDPEDGYIYYCDSCDESVEEPLPIPDLADLNLSGAAERGSATWTMCPM
jgi:hypothetical protein